MVNRFSKKFAFPPFAGTQTGVAIDLEIRTELAVYKFSACKIKIGAPYLPLTNNDVIAGRPASREQAKELNQFGSGKRV